MPNNITISCPECTGDITFDNTWTERPANVAKCPDCGWTCEVPLEQHLAPTPTAPWEV